MRLTVVGCSGSVSGPESPASSYLVQAPYAGGTFSLVLDLGPGAFGALYRYLDPAEIDAFALSHLHPDHCLDLCGYYVAAAYSPTAPWPRRPLFGPAGTPERLARAYDVRRTNGTPAEPGPGIANHFDFRTWQPRQQVGPFTVETAARRPPGRGVRDAHHRGRSGRRHAGLLRRHRALRRPGRPGPRGGPAAGGGSVAGAAGQPARAPSDRPAGRRGRAARGSRRRGADPHPAVVRPGPGAGGGAAALRRIAVPGGSRGDAGK